MWYAHVEKPKGTVRVGGKRNVLQYNQWLSSPRQPQWGQCCVRGQQTLLLRTFVGLVCQTTLERQLIHHSAFTFWVRI